MRDDSESAISEMELLQLQDLVLLVKQKLQLSDVDQPSSSNDISSHLQYLNNRIAEHDKSRLLFSPTLRSHFSQVAYLVISKVLLRYTQLPARQLTEKEKPAQSDELNTKLPSSYIPPALRSLPDKGDKRDDSHSSMEGLVLSSLEFLTAWSSVDEGGVMNSWPMMFSDGFKADRELNTVIAGLIDRQILSIDTPIRCQLSVSSPLIKLMLSGSASSEKIRLHCIRALNGIVANSSCRRWLLKLRQRSQNVADKTMKVVAKVLKYLMVVVVMDVSDNIEKEVLSCLSNLIGCCPLMTVTDSSVHYDNDPLEGIVTQIWDVMFGVIVGAARYGRDRKGTSIIRWLTKEIRMLGALKSFQEACLRQRKGEYFSRWLLRDSSGYPSEVVTPLQHVFISHYILTFSGNPAVLIEWVNKLLASNKPTDQELLARTIGALIPAKVQWISSSALWKYLTDLNNSSSHLVLLKVLEALGQIPDEFLLSLNPSAGATVVSRLIAGSSHDVSTVRTASFRALGELFHHCTLPFTQLGWDEKVILDSLLKGAADSNLAARIQSVWALSKFLKKHCVEGNSRSHSLDTNTVLWKNYHEWASAFEILVSLCRDSDKIKATALLAVGWLSKSGHSMLETGDSIEGLEQAATKLEDAYWKIVDQFLGDPDDDDLLSRLLQQFTQKVIVAAVTSLANINLRTLSILNRCIQASNGAAKMTEHTARLLTNFLKCGFLSLRVVCARGLCSLIAALKIEHWIVLSPSTLLSGLEAVGLVLDRSPNTIRGARQAVDGLTVAKIQMSREASLSCALLRLILVSLEYLWAQTIEEDQDLRHRTLDSLGSSNSFLLFLESSAAAPQETALEARDAELLEGDTPQSSAVVASAIARMLLAEASKGYSRLVSSFTQTLSPIVLFRLNNVAASSSGSPIDHIGEDYNIFEGLDPHRSYLSLSMPPSAAAHGSANKSAGANGEDEF